MRDLSDYRKTVTYTLAEIAPPPSVILPHRLASMAAVAAMTPAGCFVEVGVFRGGSAFVLWQIAEHQSRELHLFDSFTGIPLACDIDRHRIGDFADVSLERVKASIPRAQFHVGMFPSTLPDDLQNIAFVHVDCDQYETYCACIDRLWPRMVAGGAMVFDDISKARGWQ
jgi:O-methyltransferase